MHFTLGFYDLLEFKRVELLYPFHLLRVVADVLLAQLREALSLENLSLYLGTHRDRSCES